VCAAQPRTAVVVNAGAPVELPWAESAPAIVWAWYGGQEAGSAVADVLLGAADPGGRLPTTFPAHLADVACHALADERVYPGREGRVVYAEGVFMGYRHFDAHGVAPRFPFGHGLSYARFEYGALAARGDEVRLALRNAGERAGSEVVQLYVAPIAAGAARPPQQLAAFAKVELLPGEANTVALRLDPRAFSCWDAQQRAWRSAPGVYELRVGRSSRAIRSTARLVLEA
jgi:beta-glucosidase